MTALQQETLLRLLLSLISGGMLGYERSRRGIDAGFRTHIFVCMSSCAIMITNLHIFLRYETGDPMRMPAQVISGVGFLGAGCILVTGHHRIRGVTTAAGLWTAACLGLCIGAGDYIVAVFMLSMALLTMTAFRTVDERIVTRTRFMRIYAELDSVSAVTGFLKYLRAHGMKVNDMEFLDTNRSETIALVTAIQLKKPESVDTVIALVEQEEGVVFASKL